MARTGSNPLPSIRTTRRSSSPPLSSPLTTDHKRRKRALVTKHSPNPPPPPNHVSRESQAHGTERRPYTPPGPSNRGKRRAVIVEDEDEGDEDVKEERDQTYQPKVDLNIIPDKDNTVQEPDDGKSTKEQPSPLNAGGPLNTDGINTEDTQDKAEEEPLPEIVTIRLNLRRGNPNPPPGTTKGLRSIKNWPQKLFSYRIHDGYDTFIARINDHIQQIRAVKEYRGVQWWNGVQPYIKPTVSARQKSFSPLHPDDLQPQLEHALRSIMKYNTHNPGKEPLSFILDVYVYLKDTAQKQVHPVQWQSQSAMEDANRRINLAQGTEGFAMGPATQTLYATDTASQAGLPPNPPCQSCHLNERLAEQQRRQQRAAPQASCNIAAVKVYVPGDRDHWINLEIDLEDIRRLLGMEVARAGETTRGSVSPVAIQPVGGVFFRSFS